MKKQKKFFKTLLFSMLTAVMLLSGCTLLAVSKNTSEPAATATPETVPIPEVVPNVTFSASIGEVNGTIYTARASKYVTASKGVELPQPIPTCEVLPIDTAQYNVVSNFCYYDGYVYYIESEPGSSDYSTWLCRCKPDWTGKELLHTMIWNDYGSDFPQRCFVIANGILYCGYYGETDPVVTIDLSTMQKGRAVIPAYAIHDGGGVHSGKYDDDHSMVIYNDKMFFVDSANNLYYSDNGTNRFLAINAYLDGGLAGDYLYYVEYDWETNDEAMLKRISLSTGESEFIDSRMPAGGGGPYFCW